MNVTQIETRLEVVYAGVKNSSHSSLLLKKATIQMVAFLDVLIIKSNIEEALEAIQALTKVLITGMLGSLPKTKTDMNGNNIDPIE